MLPAAQPPASSPINPVVPSASTSHTPPPALPARPPLPPPPAVTLLPPLHGGQIQHSLSWRAKAYKMQTETLDGSTVNVRTSKIVPANLSDSLTLLNSSLQKGGLTVDAVCDPAGQLLAHLNDPALERIHLIFTITQLDKGHSMIKAAVDPDSHAIKTALLEDLLMQAQAAISKNGVL